jgi:hypothetical protein
MRGIRLLAAAATLAALAPAPASATWWHKNPICTPDSVGGGTVEIADSLTGNFWTFQVDYEVYDSDNCANPVSVDGSFTYVYTVTLADQGPVPISLNQMRVLIDDANYILQSGVVTGGPGDAPTSVVVTPGANSSLTATFNPGTFVLGDTSLPIYAISPYRPGNGSVNLQANLFSGIGTALVPKQLPEACPCTAAFWKLRALNWLWYNHFFPGSQFEDIKDRAVVLSQGHFANESQLLSALFYAGFLSIERKAERELAALLLNVAAGELFPGNTRCRLFPGTQLDFNGDNVADGTVGGAIGQIITNIQSNNWNLQFEAFALAYDINDGRTVLGSASFH